MKRHCCGSVPPSSARPIFMIGCRNSHEQARMTQLVDIRNLSIRFTGDRTVHAVNDLSLSLGEGEVLGLLGESGSGKSVTLRALMRLLPKKRTQISGSVQVMGRDVLALDDED